MLKLLSKSYVKHKTPNTCPNPLIIPHDVSPIIYHNNAGIKSSSLTISFQKTTFSQQQLSYYHTSNLQSNLNKLIYPALIEENETNNIIKPTSFKKKYNAKQCLVQLLNYFINYQLSQQSQQFNNLETIEEEEESPLSPTELMPFQKHDVLTSRIKEFINSNLFKDYLKEEEQFNEINNTVDNKTTSIEIIDKNKNRNQFLKEMESDLLEFKNVKLCTKELKDVIPQVFVVNGGRGTGKTRTVLSTIEDILISNYYSQLNVFKKIYLFYIPFKEICPIEVEEKLIGKKNLIYKKETGNKIVTSRMLISYFKQRFNQFNGKLFKEKLNIFQLENVNKLIDTIPLDLNHLDFEDFLKNCYEYIPVELTDTMNIIELFDTIFLEDTNNNKENGVFMIFDDYEALTKYKSESNLRATAYSLLVKILNLFPGIYKKDQTIYLPFFIGSDIYSLINDFRHKVGPYPKYKKNSPKIEIPEDEIIDKKTGERKKFKLEDYFWDIILTELPLLNKNQVESIVDNYFEIFPEFYDMNIEINNLNNNNVRIINKSNWREYLPLKIALQMIDGHPLALYLFLCNLSNLEMIDEIRNIQLLLEKTKNYLITYFYPTQFLKEYSKSFILEKIVISTLTSSKLSDIINYFQYDFDHLHRFFESGIIFPVYTDEYYKIEYNIVNDFYRTVHVPFLFLDFLIKEIPEHVPKPNAASFGEIEISKGLILKKLSTQLVNVMKSIIDCKLQNRMDLIKPEWYTELNTVYTQLMKEIKSKTPNLESTFLTPYYSNYIMDLVTDHSKDN
ncbi:hypothetical protein ABK040_011943 [Willaertia magna]